MEYQLIFQLIPICTQLSWFPLFFKALGDILGSSCLLSSVRRDTQLPAGAHPRPGDSREGFPLLLFPREPVQTPGLMLSLISALHKQLLG